MDEAINAWIFTRGETRELLGALSDEQFQFRPEGEKWQPLYYQFGCIIRTQYIYAKALETGVMDFAYFADASFPDKHASRTKAELARAFEAASRHWEEVLADAKFVDWQGQTISSAGHVYRLIAHERLHHGQLISYFTMANIELPPNFKQNWAL